MGKQIRVIKFVPYYPPHLGGLESHIAQWSERRVRGGYGEVLVVTSSLSKNGVADDYSHGGVNVISYPSRSIIAGYPVPMFWKSGFWKVWKQCAEFKADIINTHTRFFLTSIRGGIFAKRYRIPRVHIEHGVDYVKMGQRWKTVCAWIYDQVFGRRVFRQATGVIGISDGCKRFINRFTKRPVEVMRRGMDIDYKTLEMLAEKRIDYMNKYNGPIRIGFVGRVVPLKGVHLLVEAAKRLHTKNIVCEVIIVGEGESAKEIQQWIIDNSASSYMYFLGPKPSKEVRHDILPTLHIIVNPSTQEGLPTSVLEGLMSGCVVVATDVGGTREISDKEDLILIPSGTVNALELALLHAIQNYDILHDLSRISVAQYFDWEERIRPYYTYYIGMCER